MADQYPKLEVSIDGINWVSSLQVKNGAQLDVRYKVTMNGREKVQVIFPVYDADDQQAIKLDTAFFTKKDWNAVKVTITSPATATFTGSDIPGICTFDFGGNPPQDTIEFRLTSLQQTFEIASQESCDTNFYLKERKGGRWVKAGQNTAIALRKEVKLPRVLKFAAINPFIADNGSTTLEWDVDDCKRIDLFKGSFNSMPVHSWTDSTAKGKAKDTFTVNNLKIDTQFYLRCNGSASYQFVPGQTADTDTVVKVFDESNVKSISNLFDSGKLMGLYENGNVLYALVLHANLAPANVYLWQSYDGLAWTPANNNNSIIAFNGKNTSNVPLDFAGSPGAIYNNKLYLVGGSRFDINKRSNEVYFYDFGNPDAGWQKSAAKANFTARMGMCCIVYANQLWAIGGNDEDGASTGVYTFDEKEWKMAVSMPTPGCMLSGLVVNNQLQIFGGFGDIPGIYDRNITNAFYYDSARDKWASFNWTSSIEKDSYVACAVASHRDTRFLFSTIYNNQYRHRVQAIKDNELILCTDKAPFIGDSFYSIQAVPFKDVVWLCAVANEGQLVSIDLSYFFYNKKSR